MVSRLKPNSGYTMYGKVTYDVRPRPWCRVRLCETEPKLDPTYVGIVMVIPNDMKSIGTARRRDTSRGTWLPARRVLTAVFLPVLGACIGPFDPCGSDVGRFAVIVAVTDARTGGPPSSRATLVVTDGTFNETVQGPEPGTTSRVTIAAAAERPGTYDLTVSAAGYRTWTQAAVRVARGSRCDRLQTANLAARLEPQS